MDTLDTVDLTTAHVRLTRDLRDAASVLGEEEARFLADIFETKQRERIINGNRVIALEKDGEPNSLLSHFHTLDETMERQIGAALKKRVTSPGALATRSGRPWARASSPSARRAVSAPRRS